MKRFAAISLVGTFFPLAALAGPVSVYPPPVPTPMPAAKPGSLSQPLSAAVQSAASTLPPAPVMTSSPSWGNPAVLPGTLVPAAAPGCTPCDEAATCQPVKPYFNLLAARDRVRRSGCETVRGSCLDRLKDWLCFHSAPVSHGCGPVSYRAPLRAYFPCTPSAGCAGGACATGTCAPASCATRGSDCGTVTLPVRRLSAADCAAPSCRPRVMYQPLTSRSEVPAIGCDARPVRPRLFARLFSLFHPTCGTTCEDATCATPTFEPLPAPAPTPTVPPTAMPTTTTLPMTTVPVYTPPGAKANPGKVVQLTPQQPFTNP